MRRAGFLASGVSWLLVGAAWGPIQQLTFTPYPSRLQYNWGWAIDVDGAGVLHQAWLVTYAELDPRQPAAICGQVFYRQSRDDGGTWSPPMPLSEGACGIGHPKIAASAEHVYVVWHQLHPPSRNLRIHLTHSANHGFAWDPITTVSDDAPGAGAAWPSVNAWGNAVYVVWGDSRTGSSEIYLRSSTDGGRSFWPVRSVSRPDGISSWTPSVAAWGPFVHVAWTDERHNVDAAGQPFDCALVGAGESCREEEYYRGSADGGITWGEEVRLTWDPPAAPAASWAPSIAAWGGDVHVAFFDRRSGSFEIYYKRSQAAGAPGSWEDEVLLSRDASLAHVRPSLTVLGQAVHVVYWAHSPGETSVYHTGSPDRGTRWSDPQVLFAIAKGTNPHPSVAVSPSGSVHALWHAPDARGVDQIFYRALR